MRNLLIAAGLALPAAGLATPKEATPKVEYRELGKTGLKVSTLGFGCMLASDPAVIEVTREGFPILDGLRSFLVGARCLMHWRDFLEREPPSTPPVTDRAAGWRDRL